MMLTGHAFDNPTSRRRHRRARELATELDATPNQIALARLMARPFPAIPILGTTKRDHLADALGAAAIHLTSGQLQWLRNGWCR
jgi:aryl-alcohol dehydrogenase-like predicted oxidoreductase